MAFTQDLQQDQHDATPTRNLESTVELKQRATQEASQSGSVLGGFLNIPPELLLEVADSLDPVDLQALRTVCRAFYHQLPAQRWLDWATKSNRFSFACKLDRDDKLENTAICSACETLHARSCFSPSELARDPEARRCEGSQRVFYFRPGFALSAKALRSKLEEIVFDVRQAYCFDEWICAADREPVLRQDSEEHNGYILGTFKLMECAPMQIPTKKAVAEFLRQFNVPICPHTSTGDPAVIDQYFLDPVQRPGTSVLCNSAPAIKSGNCEAPDCITDFGFSLSGWKHPGINHFLVLHVIREVGNLEDPNDRAWWAQTFGPQEDAAGLRKQWAESDGYRQSQLQRGVVPGVTVNWTWASMYVDWFVRLRVF